MRFDPSAAAARLARFWNLKAAFGMERGAYHTYMNEIVSDRYVLVNGLQLLRDELQLAGLRETLTKTDITACGADLKLPTVMTTCAYTNCGDRIQQGEALSTYKQMVAARFATMSELGESKLESFAPTGGGTDDGATLAHVTVAHQLDEPLRKLIYEGNAQSFILVNLDLKTHLGRLDLPDGTVVFGKTQESPWREPRSACGAIVGTLAKFNQNNAVHRRLRRDLGEENFKLLSEQGIKTDDGVDVRWAVAAAIVAVQGMRNTLLALGSEFDERGMGHTTASITVNRPAMLDTVIYLARGTVFNGEVRMQGFGRNAAKYSASLVPHAGEKRLLLRYDGHEAGDFAQTTSAYDVRQWSAGGGHGH